MCAENRSLALQNPLSGPNLESLSLSLPTRESRVALLALFDASPSRAFQSSFSFGSNGNQIINGIPFRPNTHWSLDFRTNWLIDSVFGVSLNSKIISQFFVRFDTFHPIVCGFSITVSKGIKHSRPEFVPRVASVVKIVILVMPLMENQCNLRQTPCCVSFAI